MTKKKLVTTIVGGTIILAVASAIVFGASWYVGKKAFMNECTKTQSRVTCEILRKHS